MNENLWKLNISYHNIHFILFILSILLIREIVKIIFLEISNCIIFYHLSPTIAAVKTLNYSRVCARTLVARYKSFYKLRFINI